MSNPTTKPYILWAYQYVLEGRHYTGHINQDAVWPNQSCKEDDLELFYFEPRLIHYLDACKQHEPFIFPISQRHFTGGQSTQLANFRRQLAAFDWIPHEVLDACRRGQCTVYFEDRFEGYPEWRGIQVKYFVELANRLNIPTSAFIISTGNSKLEYVLEKYNTGLTFVHEDWFRTEFWDRKLQSNPRLEHNCSDKDFVYLCYNRHWNENRQYFVYELWRAGILDCGLVSLPQADEQQRRDINNPLYWSHWVASMLDMNEAAGYPPDYLNRLPLVLDNPTFENMAHVSNGGHFLQSYISVVTETWGDNTSAFFTEKIYKSITAEHPFMVLAGQHYLRHLRTQGFKTYDGIIDESYDLEPHEGNRARMIVAELRRISRMSKEQLNEFWLATREIAEYNRHQLSVDPEYGKNIYSVWANKYAGGSRWNVI